MSKLDVDALVREQDRDATLRPPWDPPRVLPPAWLEIERDPTGAKYKAPSMRLMVIVSCGYERDDRAWIHLSARHRDRIPTWQELAYCKTTFLGEREAYQVLPPKSRYVNLHPHVLHLFALLDDNGVALPDFTRGTGSL